MDVIIAEKPTIAYIIASALGADKKEDGFVSGNGHIVTWCYGHLLELVQPAVYDERYKKWEMVTLPIAPERFKYGVKKDAVKQYKVLKGLLNRNDVDTVVCATDAGREGELIFRNVYNYVRCNKPVRRIWVSSMEENAFREGYKNAMDGHKYDNLYMAALAREHCDWITGINLTRLFTILYGAGNVLAIGRVMTPTLQLIYQREQEIEGFQKQSFYNVHIVNDNGSIDAVSGKFDNESEAVNVARICNGQRADVVEVRKEVKMVKPPLLYDLTTLQRDCNRLYGYTANETLDIAQELYEKKLTTYPRTDSTYLTSDMGEKVIDTVSKIKGLYTLTEIAEFIPENPQRLMNDKKVTDHHAIIPTGNTSGLDSLPEKSRLVYDLVSVRLFSSLSADYKYNSLSANLECQGYEFRLTGKSVIDQGYKKLERAFLQTSHAEQDDQSDSGDKAGNELPDIIKGDSFTVKTSIKKGETKPPTMYTEDTLLQAMENAGKNDVSKDVERKGLGTSATRAGIIEKLVSNGYVRRIKKKMSVTDQGKYLLSNVPDKVKSVSMTCDWENDLLLVANGEKTYDEFMDGNISYIRDIVEESRGIEPKKPAPPDSVCKCPVCSNDIVKGKYGLYCTGKCGLLLKMFGQQLTEEQCRTLIADKKEILCKGLKSSKGTTYDAYISYDGCEPHQYTNREGKEAVYYSIKCKFRFPEIRNKRGKYSRKKKTESEGQV